MKYFLISIIILITASIPLRTQEPPFLIIYDITWSMRQADPDRFSIDAVQMAFGMLRHNRSISVMGFDTRARELVPWTQYHRGNAESRNAARDLFLGRVSFDGRGTRYAPALNGAYDLLEEQNAPPGTRLIFFTDGDPQDSAQRISDAAQRFADRNWIIDCMMLNTGTEGMRPDLRDIAQTTRGSFLEVNTASQLVDGFVALSRSQSDAFGIDLTDWDPQTGVDIPPGVERLSLIVARKDQRRNNGMLQSIAINGFPVNFSQPNIFQYPVTNSDRANIDVIGIDDPNPGRLTAQFDGIPERVYVNLTFDYFFSEVPIPNVVQEGTTVTTGIRVRDHQGQPVLQHPGLDNVTVHSQLVHLPTGTILSDAPALRHNDSDGIAWTHQWPSNLGEGIDRSKPNPVAVRYRIELNENFYMNKNDRFVIAPLEKPPVTVVEPTLTWRVDNAVLPPTWTGIETSGTISVVGSNLEDTVSIRIGDGFRLEHNIGPNNESSDITAYFQHETPGLHSSQTRYTLSEKERHGVTVVAHNYPWDGNNTLSITSDGSPVQTPLPNWSPGHPDLPSIQLREQTIRVHGPITEENPDTGTQHIDLSLDENGIISITEAGNALRGLYVGSADLEWSGLPRRNTRIEFTYAPAPAQLSLDKPNISISPGEAWQWNHWAEWESSLGISGGLEGSLVAHISDLVGPHGDILTLDHDVRISVAQSELGPDDRIPLQIRVYRPRYAHPGEYTGTATVVHTAVNGETTVLDKAVTVQLPE